MASRKRPTRSPGPRPARARPVSHVPGPPQVTLKNRIHSTLINFGRPCPVTDLFGAEGRRLLARLYVPELWRSNVRVSLELIDHLERQIDDVNRRLKAGHADHPYIPLLMSVPGIRWVLAFTIAAEIGEIERFSSPQKLTGYTGLCPRVDHRAAARPPRPVDQARADLPALGPARGDDACPKASRLSRALPAQQAPTRQAARRQGRSGRHRPKACACDLAHADPKPTFAPRAPLVVWRLDRPLWNCVRERSIQFRLILPTRRP